MKHPEAIIKHAESFYLIGLSMPMNLIDNKTPLLWQGFMPQRNAISNRIDDRYISLQQYPPGYFEAFNPATPFEKWAGVVVSEITNMPSTLNTLLVAGGFYAVFIYDGSIPPPSIFENIYAKWLPSSGYKLENRPHFEVLHADYLQGNRAEEIWIPLVENPPQTQHH